MSIQAIIDEMKKLGADGVEFVPVFSDYSKPYKIIMDVAISDIDRLGAVAKTNKRYYKLVDDEKVYLSTQPLKKSFDEWFEELMFKMAVCYGLPPEVAFTDSDMQDKYRAYFGTGGEHNDSNS